MKKLQITIRQLADKLQKILGIFSFLFFLPVFASAAVLHLESPSQAYVNQRTEIAVIFDPGAEIINALEGSLEFSARGLDILEINDGGVSSLLWVKKPTVTKSAENWLVDFSAVAPGGLRGHLFSIIGKPKIEGNISGGQGNGTALLNDGLGTKQALQILPFSLLVLPEDAMAIEAGSEPDDRIPPEHFIPQIARDSQIFEGQWFLVFHTRDQGLGLSHFEVLETPSNKDPGVLSGWAEAESPFLLKDQALESKIYVKAVDKAGNKTIEKVSLPKAESSHNYANKIIWGIILLSLFLALLWYVKIRYLPLK